MRTSTRWFVLVLVLVVGLLATASVGAVTSAPRDGGASSPAAAVGFSSHEAVDGVAAGVTNGGRRWQPTLPDGRRLLLLEVAALLAALAAAGSLQWTRRTPVVAAPLRSRPSGALAPSRAPPLVAHTR